MLLARAQLLLARAQLLLTRAGACEFAVPPLRSRLQLRGAPRRYSCPPPQMLDRRPGNQDVLASSLQLVVAAHGWWEGVGMAQPSQLRLVMMVPRVFWFIFAGANGRQAEDGTLDAGYIFADATARQQRGPERFAHGPQEKDREPTNDPPKL